MKNRILYPENDLFSWERLREVSGNCVVLSFSCGKDSLALWLALRDRGFDVVPYYKEIAPRLEFVEHSLNYYERFFGTHIHRCASPGIYAWIRANWYQPPGRVGVIEDLDLPRFGPDDVADGVRRATGCESAWQAIGTRKADSIMRSRRMSQDGFTASMRNCMPIMDWRKEHVLGAISGAGCLLPIDYEMFGRSFDGLYARYLIPIRDRFPRDYAKLVELFPLCTAEIARYEMGVKHGIL